MIKRKFSPIFFPALVLLVSSCNLFFDKITNEGSISAPVVLTLDAAHNGHVGTASAGTGESYYRFTAGSAGYYGIKASNLTGTLYFKLYSDSGFTALKESADSAAGITDVVLDSATVYYLKVINENSSGLEYTLLLSRTGDLPRENTAEGSIASPVELTLDTAHSGKVGSTNDNFSSYYKFTAGDTGYYKIAVTGLSAELTFHVCVKSDFNSIIASPSSTEGISSIALSAAATYYLRVANSSGVNQVYTITVSWIGASPSEGSIDSPVSLTISTAYSGRVGGESGLNTSYYKFTSGAAGTYTIMAANLSEKLSFYLYNDSTFTTIKSNASSTKGLSYVELSGGTTYYLKIYNDTGNNQTYTLGVYPPYLEGSPDSPVVLTTETPYSGKVGSSETSPLSYYKFTTGDTGYYAILASNLSSPLNFTLYTDSEFKTHKASSSTTKGIGSVGLTGATTYYLKVCNYNSKDVAYTLTVSYLGTTSNEGSTSSPVALTIDAEYNGRAGEYGDNDFSYYKFTTGTAGSYTVTASNCSGALYFYVYSDAAFSTQKAYFNTSDNTGVSLDAATTYFLKVENGSTYDISYTIKISRGSDALNDGSRALPATLSLDAPYSCKVAAYNYNSTDDTSYYKFTTDTAGCYTIAASNLSASLGFYLYNDSGYSMQIDYADFSTTGLSDVTLNESSIYYLRVDNHNSSTLTYSLTISRTGDVPNEGDTSSPVQLTVDTSHSARIGAFSSYNDFDSSWYKFTTGEKGVYSIFITDIETYSSPSYYLYTDSTYTSQITRTNKYELQSNTTYYLKIINNQVANLSYTLRVSRIGDGYVTAPIILTLESPFSGRIPSNNYSWYTFTTGDAGAYAITTADLSVSLKFSLYVDSAFSGNSVYVESSTTGISNVPLYSNTTYYLLITNTHSSNVTYTLTVSYTGDSPNEGSKIAPVELFLDTGYAGKVGTSSIPGGDYSWYKFTTGSAGAYAVNASSLTTNISFGLYTNSFFSNGKSFYDDTTRGLENILLDSSTTYYLKILNSSGLNTSYTLNLTRLADTANEGSEANPVILTIGTPHESRIGNAAQGTSYYTFTTGEAGTYDITASDLDSSMNFYVYSISFNGMLKGSDNSSTTGISGVNLAASTQYYLEVYNPMIYFDPNISKGEVFTLTVTKQ